MFCSLSPLFGIRQGLFKDGQSFLFLPGEFRDGGKTLELPRFSSVAMASSTNRSIPWSLGPDSTVNGSAAQPSRSRPTASAETWVRTTFWAFWARQLTAPKPVCYFGATYSQKTSPQKTKKPLEL